MAVIYNVDKNKTISVSKGDLVSIYKDKIPALVLSDHLPHGSIHVMYLSGTKKQFVTTHIYTHYVNNSLSKCKA